MRVKSKTIKKLAKLQKERDGVEYLMPYAHFNIQARHIFWKRFDIMMGMADRGTEKTVLDFGCGGGIFFPTLTEKYGKVHGVDISIQQSRDMVDELGLDVSLYEIKDKLPFDDNFFDIILCADVLEHIEDLDKTVKELTRVLKPQGQIIISSPTESIIYRIGRLFFGYSNVKDILLLKQHEDHKDCVDGVMKAFVTDYEIEKTVNLPFMFTLFKIAGFRKC